MGLWLTIDKYSKQTDKQTTKQISKRYGRYKNTLNRSCTFSVT